MDEETQCACLSGEHLAHDSRHDHWIVVERHCFQQNTLSSLWFNTLLPASCSACVHNRWINSWIKNTTGSSSADAPSRLVNYHSTNDVTSWGTSPSPFCKCFLSNRGGSRRRLINRRHLDKKKTCFIFFPVVSPVNIKTRVTSKPQWRRLTQQIHTVDTHTGLYFYLCADPQSHNASLQALKPNSNPPASLWRWDDQPKYPHSTS